MPSCVPAGLRAAARPAVASVLLALFSLSLTAQGVRDCGTTSVGTYRWVASGQLTRSNNCLGSTGFRCYPVEGDGSSAEKTNATCDPAAGSCGVKIHATATIPGVRDMINEDGLTLTPLAEWYACSGAGCTKDIICGLDAAGGRVNFDNLDTWVETGLTCAQALALNLSVKIRVCPTSACEVSKVIDLPGVATAAAIGCPPPPPPSKCPDDQSCSLCIGPAGGSSPAGGGPGVAPPKSGPGAQLRYAAGGVGFPNLPGSADWTPVLGKGWSHDHAERIVPAPDETHVWLLTRYGTFREFSVLAGGVYTIVRPSDEYRQLTRTATGWELRELDGGVHVFDSTGLWLRTVDRNGNATVGTYSSGRLASVSFPDGRSETYAYAGGGTGKLASITEVGLGGSPTRPWFYTWTGDNLTRIDRPDGTAWEFFYTNAGFPNNMTRMDLVGTDFAHRVEAAWALDAAGNVQKTWKGDPADPSTPGSMAVDVYTFSYNQPGLPSLTTVLDPLGKTITYTIGRDAASIKPKLTRLEGDCPACGVGPNSQMFYDFPAHPLLPSRSLDGKLIETQYQYNSRGRMISKTEAVGTSLARTTIWQYGNPSFPGFPTRIDMPSTSGGGAQRTTVLSYNTAGDLETSTIQGAEGGSSFTYATASTFNVAGQPLTINPPGYGTADQTSFTYDPSRGNLLPLTRTEPLVGATTFAYDGFNRRTSVINPNSVQTVTAYDSLDRITSVTQKGATPAEDLTATYVYNALGDPFRTILPRGNVIEYSYDAAGRLKSLERKSNTSTPGERTSYTLNGFGHRTKEELQHWTGSAWVTDSFTDFVYSSRCHLDKAINADSTATEYAYDCNGNLEKVWDAKHPKATNPTPTQLFGYDSLNRMTAVTQPWGGAGGDTAVTSYGYDVQDHLNRVTDAEMNVTTYTYGDRDLMTAQVSPVSGTTTYAYNEHGELTSEIDARSVITTRTVDSIDRVIAVTYPNSSLNVAYTYDDPGVSFSKGRLTRIASTAATIDYRYDRFGRMIQDGELTYGYDTNGNPVSLMYPGGVEAVSTFDFTDRPSTLLARRSGKPDQPLVNAASYLPFGPLTSLTLGNGLVETHGFTNRYLPSSIALTGVLSWTLGNDAVGNLLSITTASPANNRTYGYQDHQYFLTMGNGPWGTRSWTYDKIGNRLTDTRGGVTDTYSYVTGTAGHTPKLSQIQLGGGGTRTYQYDSAGNLDTITTGGDSTYFTTDAAGRLAGFGRNATGADASFSYDGRGYLSFADPDKLPFYDGFESGTTCAWTSTVGLTTPQTCTLKQNVRPTYSAEGLLHSLTRNIAPNRSLVFHFFGRPVAQLDLTGTTESWKFLTTDHLGTPIAATSTAGSALWQGAFEPFGADWSNATAAGVFLRLPGQWREEVWENVSGASGLYYNVYRWYQSGIGRYIGPDPIGLNGGVNSYASVLLNPTNWIDPLGLSPKPVKPKDQQWRACTPEETMVCEASCGEKGMMSCRVSQTFRLVRQQAGGLGLRKWVDGRMSCSCNEESPVQRCVRNVRQTVQDIIQWLADHPPVWPPLPLPGPGAPIPVPAPGH
ncbi:MAG TPA: RHS repeat-associated core domain-containing protein [Thermoanaerobaculia bacterium]|nr:RHS repeat-associated core domain-containing protein [Thermoanaerobaculia bacterium]